MAGKSAVKELKAKIVSQYKQSTTDTGSPEVQVALITNRIQSLNEHLKSNQKDFSCRNGLMKLVGQRRDLLNYLKSTDAARYLKLINALELRK